MILICLPWCTRNLVVEIPSTLTPLSHCLIFCYIKKLTSIFDSLQDSQWTLIWFWSPWLLPLSVEQKLVSVWLRNEDGYQFTWEILNLFISITDCPRIITRAQWGSRAATTAVLPIRPAPFVVIHHTAGAACTTEATCAQQMRNIQNQHMNTNGWADIGYNYLIGGDGNIYEGRGWGRQGAHAPGYNNQSVGVAFIGLFTSALPTLNARNAAQALINCGISLNHIRPAYWVIGHRQGSATACPGNALFENLRTWPRFNANPSPL